MTTNIRNLSLVTVAGLALTLSACGGGGGSSDGPVTGGGNMPVQPGDTTPITVQIGSKTDISSIHLEMADFYIDFSQTGSVAYEGVQGAPLVHNSLRGEMVCPGIPPRGNECISRAVQIDGGSRRSVLAPEDFSIDVQASLFETMIDRLSLFRGGNNGIEYFTGTIRPLDLAFEALGGWGEYFGMYSIRSNPRVEFQQGIRTWAASFGSLHSGYPTAVPRFWDMVWPNGRPYTQQRYRACRRRRTPV